MMTETGADELGTEVILDMQNGEYLQFDMTLPLQMLFDDVMTFVSRTDLE